MENLDHFARRLKSFFQQEMLEEPQREICKVRSRSINIRLDIGSDTNEQTNLLVIDLFQPRPSINIKNNKRTPLKFMPNVTLNEPFTKSPLPKE